MRNTLYPVGRTRRKTAIKGAQTSLTQALPFADDTINLLIEITTPLCCH